MQRTRPSIEAKHFIRQLDDLFRCEICNLLAARSGFKGNIFGPKSLVQTALEGGDFLGCVGRHALNGRLEGVWDVWGVVLVAWTMILLATPYGHIMFR